MRADDKGVIEDIPSWCNRTANEFLGIEEVGDINVSYVRKVWEGPPTSTFETVK